MGTDSFFLLDESRGGGVSTQGLRRFESCGGASEFGERVGWRIRGWASVEGPVRGLSGLHEGLTQGFHDHARDHLLQDLTVGVQGRVGVHLQQPHLRAPLVRVPPRQRLVNKWLKPWSPLSLVILAGHFFSVASLLFGQGAKSLMV